MLAMGRALMGAPRLLMLDEPSLGPRAAHRRRIFRTIGELRASGVSMLLVEQNARAALAVADHAYVMELGEFVLSGPAQRDRDQRASPRAISAFSTRARARFMPTPSFPAKARHPARVTRAHLRRPICMTACG